MKRANKLIGLAALFLIVFFIYILLSSGSFAEETFFVDINDEKNYGDLINEMSQNNFVLLGEATHGTQEFYEIRGKLSKMLIEEHGFDFIAVEGDWNSIYELNLYVKGISEKNSAREILSGFDRWPEWMWANKEIEELSEWLKEFNEGLPFEERVGFYGMDVYGAENSLLVVQEMTDLKYECMSQFSNDFSDYAGYLYYRNEPCSNEVNEIYNEIKNSETFGSDFDDREFFYLKQNALVVKNAEKHYRGMVYQNVDSWNERVLHMNKTLENLVEYKGDKAIVWAHNTHVGDSRFSAMSQTNNFNIGQLLRESGSSVFILGFGTFKGNVLAGGSWGQEKEIMNIPEANENSYEYLFESLGIENSLIIFEGVDLPEEIESINNNRAIGVVYNPQTEYPGNYVPTDIKNRYDAFIFIRKTSELKTI